MANSSAKKLHKANRRRLTLLAAAILIPSLAYILRWFLLSAPASSFHKVVFAVLTVIHAVLFALIWLSAKPSYSNDGALIDAGHDISAPGMLEYVHDIIYLTVFIQLLLLFTRWALLLYMTVPIFAIYLSCGTSGNLFSEPEHTDQPPDFTAMTRKERRKAERSAKKHRS